MKFQEILALVLGLSQQIIQLFKRKKPTISAKKIEDQEDRLKKEVAEEEAEEWRRVRNP